MHAHFEKNSLFLMGYLHSELRFLPKKAVECLFFYYSFHNGKALKIIFNSPTYLGSQIQLITLNDQNFFLIINHSYLFFNYTFILLTAGL